MSRSPQTAAAGTDYPHPPEPSVGEAVDPRGWAMVSADGVRMGEVCGVLGRGGPAGSRYLDCELDADVLDLHDDRRVLVPVDETRLDSATEQVLALRLTRDDLIQLPELAGDEDDAVTRRMYESVLRSPPHSRARPPLRRRGTTWPAVGYGDDI